MTCNLYDGKINQSLKQQYSKWGKVHPGLKLVRHGLVDEQAFESAKVRIVLLGKEVNSMEYSDFDLLKFLKGELEKGDEGKNIKRADIQAGLWAYGILTDFNEDFSSLNINKCAAFGLRRIGWTNLSKIAGGGKADSKSISERAKSEKALWSEELRIMKPRVILCSGEHTYNLMTKLLDLKRKPLLDKTSQHRKFSYSIWRYKCLCIDYYHHAARGDYKKLYEILKEVFIECKRCEPTLRL
ncbi:MAG: hypothetical protein ABSA18_17980 [Dehalococcoidia bacterium]|jgi:uracil-DNA glycosylase